MVWVCPWVLQKIVAVEAQSGGGGEGVVVVVMGY
jgi:hypothetical protein